MIYNLVGEQEILIHKSLILGMKHLVMNLICMVMQQLIRSQAAVEELFLSADLGISMRKQ
jgi:hypothetical protein